MRDTTPLGKSDELYCPIMLWKSDAGHIDVSELHYNVKRYSELAIRTIASPYSTLRGYSVSNQRSG